MLLPGLLLFGVAGALASLLIMQNPSGPDAAVSLFGFRIATLDTAQAFLAGIAVALACCLGLALVVGSLHRRFRRRTSRAKQRREMDRLRAERDALAARLSIPLTPHAADYDEGLEPTKPLTPASAPAHEPAPDSSPWANPW